LRHVEGEWLFAQDVDASRQGYSDDIGMRVGGRGDNNSIHWCRVCQQRADPRVRRPNAVVVCQGRGDVRAFVYQGNDIHIRNGFACRQRGHASGSGPCLAHHWFDAMAAPYILTRPLTSRVKERGFPIADALSA